MIDIVWGNYFMVLTKHEKYMLSEALDFAVHRYLLANTCGREDGHEKALRHMEISGIIVGFIRCERYHEVWHFQIMKEVHDYLAEILTDKMDEVIGFPIFERPNDYNDLTKKFIDVIISHMNELEKIVKMLKRK